MTFNPNKNQAEKHSAEQNEPLSICLNCKQTHDDHRATTYHCPAGEDKWSTDSIFELGWDTREQQQADQIKSLTAELSTLRKELQQAREAVEWIKKFGPELATRSILLPSIAELRVILERIEKEKK